ncbi:carbon-nitrogen hydrolase family protein, partial [Candidatus Poribacteria bacterium]|nr:carbon-nitrogen hydrolase family protein [Candidatus Poribacteria bacterium]
MALTIGAAQSEPSRGNVAENLVRHLRLVRLAAKHEAQALVFPELSLTGYELDLAARLAFSEDDVRLQPLAEAAADHDMVLVVGAPARLASGLHIGAFIVYPDGGIELYTKHHVGGDEGRVFQPGDRNPSVRLRNATGAVAICADTNQASHPGAAAARG